MRGKRFLPPQLGFFLWGLVFFFATPTLAQTETDLFSASATDENALFQEIPSVYSASKYEQKVTEAPSAVTIVTADEIKKYGYRTLADILQSCTSLQLYNAASGTSKSSHPYFDSIKSQIFLLRRPMMANPHHSSIFKSSREKSHRRDTLEQAQCSTPLPLSNFDVADSIITECLCNSQKALISCG